MDDKTRKALKGIVNKYNSPNKYVGDDIRDDLVKLIEPKPEFVKGELVHVSDDGNDWFLQIYNYKNTKNNHICHHKQSSSNDLLGWVYCRPLETIPIALIPHDSDEQPEGLKDDDLIMYHRKEWSANYTLSRFFENITSWGEIDGYKKINFLGGE